MKVEVIKLPMIGWLYAKSFPCAPSCNLYVYLHGGFVQAFATSWDVSINAADVVKSEAE